MNVAFYRRDDDRSRFFLAFPFNERLEKGDSSFHRVGAGDELGQEIHLLVVQLADAVNGRNQELVDNLLRRHAPSHGFFSIADSGVAFPIEDGLIYRIGSRFIGR